MYICTYVHVHVDCACIMYLDFIVQAYAYITTINKILYICIHFCVQEGLTPMMAAVLCSSIDIVRILISHGAIVNCYKV